MNTAISKIGETACPVPKSPIDEQLSQMSSQLQRLTSLIEEVSERLSSVLMPVPSDPQDASEIESEKSPLGRELKELCLSLELRNDQLRELINRLAI